VIGDVALVVAAYLVGSIPFGYILPRLLRGDDIRRHGSGNVGATNVWRIYGRSLGLPVAVLDVLKGLVPAALGLWLGGDWVGVLAGAAAMLGHARPVYLGFSKGGKMVATIHPSYILRIEDEGDKRAQYRQFVRDLKASGKAAAKK